MKHYLKELTSCLFIAIPTLFFGCTDEKFDPDKAREMYEKEFPAKSISPIMDWKTTARADINISMSEGNGGDYDIILFSADPLNAESNAQVLAEGYINSRTPFQTKIDYPTAISTVYVLCKDSQGAHLLKTAPITNDMVSFNFNTFSTDPSLQTTANPVLNKAISSPFVYTYAFEDNYPLVSDFDFNDLVIDVTQKYKRDNSNKVQQVIYSFKIRAIGGTNGKGTALRLIGVNKNQIGNIEFSDPQSMRGNLANSVFENAPMESGEEVIIPIVGNAHKLFGYDQRTVLNTGVGPNINPITMTMTITLADQSQTIPAISLDNMDFFIAYGSSNRTEIHLYEFRKYGATSKGTIHEQYMAVAGKITWALCIPSFIYPFEFIRLGEAYPQFTLWATSGGSEYQDWYKHPNSNTNRVYLFKD